MIVCKRCGKEFSESRDSIHCPLCEATLYGLHTAGANPRKAGITKAILSTVFGFVGSVFTTSAALLPLAVALPVVFRWPMTVGIVLLALLFLGTFFAMALLFAIAALICGIASIRRFLKTPSGIKKPIATLILGIYGVFCFANCAIALVISLCTVPLSLCIFLI